MLAGLARRSAPAAAEDTSLDQARRLYKWSDQLTAALIRLRAEFDGDLDRFLLHSIFVQSEIRRGLARAEAAQRGRSVGGGPVGLNALSLSEITGIPRETARRKLKQLGDAGMLRQGADGLHYLVGPYPGARFARDFAPLLPQDHAPPRSRVPEAGAEEARV
jgi:hypothetical protein